MCDDTGNTFIATLNNILLAPDLCDRLFSIMALMNAGHTRLFQNGFCTVYFGAEKKNEVTLPHIAQRKHHFAGKIKNMPKKNTFPEIKKVALELLHQRLEKISTIPLLAGDTEKNWEDAELRIELDPCCTSCKIYSMNRKARSKITLKPKAPF